MFHFINSKRGIWSQANTRRSALRIMLLAAALSWLNTGKAQSQSRTLPSHGKIKLDSYNHLLRDVHPASQAQANYLQNRLFATGLKKAERLERWERLDSYAERQFINTLQDYNSVARKLAAGRPTSAKSLTDFWMLVSVYGDHAEVYDSLSNEVPPIPHDQFVPTLHFIQILQPSGDLEPLPVVLEDAKDVDARKLRAEWSALVRDLHLTGRASTDDVTSFQKGVANYRQQCADTIQRRSPGRLHAKKYLSSLRALADALYRPQQSAQIRQFMESGGYAFYGDNVLALFQHMLRNRVAPAQGSAAQLALAEVARPISRVLEQEIALHYERIDSLAANEGHRPYAAEYRRYEGPADAMRDLEVTQSPLGNDPGT